VRRSINAVLANAVLKPCLRDFRRKLAKKYFFTKPSPAVPAVPLVWARSFSLPPAVPPVWARSFSFCSDVPISAAINAPGYAFMILIWRLWAESMISFRHNTTYAEEKE